ncbi:MAG: biotin transporter BioY [Rhodospirillaceae bacterium]
MRISPKDLVLMAIFAAFVAALGLIPKITLPLGVPITAQTLGVMLAGIVLGPKRAFGALAIFTLLVLLGLPLLAGGRGGLGLLAGPSGGFLLGFAPAAAAVGWFSTSFGGMTSTGGFAQGVRVFLASVLGGIVVLYGFGIPYWVMMTDNAVSAVLATAVIFLPGDLLKAVLCAVIASALIRAYPPLFED